MHYSQHSVARRHHHTYIKGCLRPGRRGLFGEFSELGQLRKFSGNSVQPQVKIVANKIVSPDAVSMLPKCSKIWLQSGLHCFSQLPLCFL